MRRKPSLIERLLLCEFRSGPHTIAVFRVPDGNEVQITRSSGSSMPEVTPEQRELILGAIRDLNWTIEQALGHDQGLTLDGGAGHAVKTDFAGSRDSPEIAAASSGPSRDEAKRAVLEHAQEIDPSW